MGITKLSVLIKTFLYRWILPKLIAKACDITIPRSGKKGEAVNCYAVNLDRDDLPYFMVTSINGDELTGKTWDGSSFAVDAVMPISDLENGSLKIIHFIGLSEVTYESIFNFVWHYVTRIIYLELKIRNYLGATNQYLFNKRKLVTKSRMDLLQFMMDDQLDRREAHISSFQLMTKIYSLKLFGHPSLETQKRKMDLYLGSLVLSGELEEDHGNYVVTGQSISTIEKYEEEERRHTEAVKMQRKMFWLTMVAVAFAVVQSGVIKLPTILDLSNNHSEKNENNDQIESATKAPATEAPATEAPATEAPATEAPAKVIL